MKKDVEVTGLPAYKEVEPLLRGRFLLQQQVDTSRAQHLDHITSAFILPILSSRASRGLSKTTIALIPSKASSSSSKYEKPVELIGLANPDEAFQELQLIGDFNTTEFWGQDDVLQSLQALLSETLASSSSATAVEATEYQREEPASKRSPWFGKRNIPLPVTSVKQPASRTKVDVVREEVYYRTENEFGLYETISTPSVVIRVVSH